MKLIGVFGSVETTDHGAGGLGGEATGLDSRKARHSAREDSSHFVRFAAHGHSGDEVGNDLLHRGTAHQVDIPCRSPGSGSRGRDVVERGEKVEVQNMRLDEVRAQNQVAQDAGVGGNRDAGGVFESHDRCGGVRNRADAADALGDVGRVFVSRPTRIFKAPELGSGALRVGDLLLAADGVYRDLHFHVSFNAGHGINDCNCCHFIDLPKFPM